MPFEEDLLEYIRHQGPRPILKISKDLQTPFSETMTTIKKLHREGKIKIIPPPTRRSPIRAHLRCPSTIIPPPKPPSHTREASVWRFADAHVYPPPSIEERKAMKFRKELKRILDEYRMANLES